MNNHPYKLAPIELSYLKALESSKEGHTFQSLVDSINYVRRDKAEELAAPILRRFKMFGLAFDKEGIYYRRKP